MVGNGAVRRKSRRGCERVEGWDGSSGARRAPALRRDSDHRPLAALLKAFRVEQTDPAHFYGTLADDAVAQVGRSPRSTALRPRRRRRPRLLPGAFTEAGGSYLAVDHDRSELTAADLLHHLTVLGSGMDLPLRTGAVDVCFSSNVLEHVPTRSGWPMRWCG